MLAQLPRRVRHWPKVLVARAPDSRVSPFVEMASDQFRAAGIDLLEAINADEAYQLIHAAEPNVVFLAADLPDESAYLACAKIKLSQPKCKVFVVSHEASPADERLARFAGATAMVDTENGAQAIVAQVNTRQAVCCS